MMGNSLLEIFSNALEPGVKVGGSIRQKMSRQVIRFNISEKE
jgi:hypothetical protein